ncbi:MAG: branched-chain amino acid ABC transporter permease [Betaproteobacteria bacterium]|jgi:branched-chain amino acid transport system permease protein|nr:branched-chain amino acid ABC transporter permease [Betaproteobacteria bacterium]
MTDRTTNEPAPVTGGAMLPARPARRLVPWLIGLAVMIPLPWIAVNEYQRYLLDLILINVILAVGLNIVKGFAGQVTVGHIAMMAIGAYTSAVLTTKFGVPFWLALPSAMLVTAAAGAIVGIPSFRLEGAYLALATLGLAESVRIFISATDYLGASVGYSDIPPPSLFGMSLDSFRSYYFVVMPLAVAGVYFSFCMLRSNIGRAFKALREDPLAAAASGINVRKYKSLAFIVSALYAGCAGSLAAHMSPGFLHPNSYTVVEMVTVLLMVILGGIGHVWGGIIGAIIVTIIYDLTREYYQYQLLIFGLVIVLTVMFMPTGIGGIIDRYLVNRGFAAIRKARKDAA